MPGADTAVIWKALPAFFLLGAFFALIYGIPRELTAENKNRSSKLIKTINGIMSLFRPVLCSVIISLAFYVRLDGRIRLIPIAVLLCGYYLISKFLVIPLSHFIRIIMRGLKRFIAVILYPIDKLARIIIKKF